VDTPDLNAVGDQQLRQQTDSADDGAMTRSEERLVVGTNVVEIGRARLRKHVVTEEVQVTVLVRREELRLDRDPLPAHEQFLVEDPDVFGTDEDFVTAEGGVIFEVTLHEERPVVTTEIVAVERVRLNKLVRTDQEIVSGEVRKEHIDVEVAGQAPTTLGSE
jgi:stress response protein YsnF